MHPLKQLQRLLQPSTTHQGRVISQTENSLFLATSKGSFSVTRSPNDATKYKVGDTVLMANGAVVGRRNREPSIYVV